MEALNHAASGEKQQDSLARAFDKAARQPEQSRQQDLTKQAGRDRQRGDG